MAELKLIALDADDLAVLSAHLQDAVLRVADIAYLPKEQRFAAVGNRFDWMTAAGLGEGYARRRAAVRFERVLGAQVQAIDLKNKGAVLSLLAITFAPYSAETIAFVEACRAGGHPVVAITDSLSSPLQRLNVLPLLVSEVDVGAFRALSATFALAIALAVALGAKREAEDGAE